MSVARSVHPAVFQPLQAKFLTIPQTPLCYWLRDRFFELLAGRTLADVADVLQGIATGENARFVRFVWEANPAEWARAVRDRRWVPFEKGGGFSKWFGHHFWALDWEHDGARIKATPGPRVQNDEHYFKDGWTYSGTARGSLGVRSMRESVWYAVHSDSVIPRVDNSQALAAILNSRVGSAAVRWVRPQLDLSGSYVSRIPIPEHVPGELAPLTAACITLKGRLVACDLTERTFAGPRAVRGLSLAAAHDSAAAEAQAVAAVLHALEGLSERQVFTTYGIAGDDLAAILDETGTPAGWYPLIEGYDETPRLPEGLAVPKNLFDPLAGEPRRALSGLELSELKARLRALYEAGLGATVEAEDVDTTEEDEEEEVAVSGARIPIPAETFLEELAQKLEVHPISVYWLLRELGEGGVVCEQERRRFVEDYFSVLVLRLLGHRWPREIEAGEPAEAWQDPDGVIPLMEGTSEPTLPARVRERLAADFGGERVNAIESEFAQIIGETLYEWLGGDFFRRHISQFRKRPIAWQLQSTPSETGKSRKRSVRRRAPVFSCLLYYHRLDADLLPKLRTQYVGPLRARMQTELSGLERTQSRTACLPVGKADQDARRLELEAGIEELKQFDACLEKVIVRGCDSPALEPIAGKEPLDKWTSRDLPAATGAAQAGGRSPAPASAEEFLVQEQKYDPDLNDGVRVNIAPLQRAGLLATDVLAAKDIEKAIADRAEWRADERRWCREGKLPQPGWWPKLQEGSPT